MAVLPVGGVFSAALAQNKPATGMPMSPGKKKDHRLIIQVNTNDPALMHLALNNASNAEQHYKAMGEQVHVEIVTFGPGLNMLREDTSPVKDRIRSVSETSPLIVFAACDNTRANMSRIEQKDIPLVAAAKLVPSGVVRIIELQEQGWSYLRP